MLAFGRTLFLWGSAIGFWYMIMPKHYIDIIVQMITWGIIFAIAFVIVGNLMSGLVRLLYKRFSWARWVFTNPRRR